jgi:hypothetical protein
MIYNGRRYKNRQAVEQAIQLESIRRNRRPHTRASCGGCVGFYNKAGKLVIHRPLRLEQLI